MTISEAPAKIVVMSQTQRLTRETHLTLYSLLQGHQLRQGAPISRGGMPATKGLQPKRFPKGEGLKTLAPEELLSVLVPVARIRHGKIEGYQRSFNATKARAIGKWIEDNKTGKAYLKMLPVIEISVVGTSGDDYVAFYTDGQHRAAGAVIAGHPIRAVITKRTPDEARRLFTLQGKATRPSRNLLIIDSDGPYEEYIQDAMTSDNHPWSNLITNAVSGSSKNRMSATAAFTMLQIYIRGKISPAGRDVGNVTDQMEFSREDADELAIFMAAFGTRVSNPVAYSSVGLRAIALTARAVFKSRERHDGDFNRWITRMPTFNFANYIYLKSSTELADQMIRFWNHRMPAERKAARID